MWQPLSKALEYFGRIRFINFGFKNAVIVGKPEDADYLNGSYWRAFAYPRELSSIWSPPPESPWYPFHVITLFVSLDSIKRHCIGPLSKDPIDFDMLPLDLPWFDRKAITFVDLDGPQSAALGAWLACKKGCELVCTFNNWPNPLGIMKPEITLSALLRYSSWLDKQASPVANHVPVVWLCDNKRLGTLPGRPGEFDNRYYLDDSILPGVETLRRHCIERLVYVCAKDAPVVADLVPYFFTLQSAGIYIERVNFSTPQDLAYRESLILHKTSFTPIGFFKSSAGGFGGPVPHPSSGG